MTVKPTQTYGKPPKYPSSQMVPQEFWRKQPDGIHPNPQNLTIETPTGPQKRPIARGWEVPVFLGDSDDDPDA